MKQRLVRKKMIYKIENYEFVFIPVRLFGLVLSLAAYLALWFHLTRKHQPFSLINEKLTSFGVKYN